MGAGTRDDLVRWLHRLDSYTNSEFGRARTLWALRDACVACDAIDGHTSETGLCRRCLAQRVPDYSDVVMFRPLRHRRAADPSAVDPVEE